MVRRIVLPALACAFAALAADAPLDRATLKGVKAVNVIIDELPPALAKERVTVDALQTRLTERLRDGHVTVDPAAKEFVGIRVASVRDKKGPYAVCITIGFYQPVTLARDPATRTTPQTWDVETVLMADPKVLYDVSMESIDELASRFISAWRSVNPE